MLLAGICFGHPFFNVSVGPLPVTADRVLLAGLLVLTLCYRRLGWTEPQTWTKADLGPGRNVCRPGGQHVYARLAHLQIAAAGEPALFVSAAACAVLDRAAEPKSANARSGACSRRWPCSAVYLAVTAIAETHQVWALVWPRYIGSPEFVEFFGRGRGPLLNPAGSGILQGLCLVATLLLWPRLSRRRQLLFLAVLPLLAWGIYSTFTRSAWLGAGLGVLVVLALTLPRCWRTPIVATCLLAALPTGGRVLGQPVVASNATNRSVPPKRPNRPGCGRSWPSVAWHMFSRPPPVGLRVWTISRRKPGRICPIARPICRWKKPGLMCSTMHFWPCWPIRGWLGMSLFAAALWFWLREAWRLWHARARRRPSASSDLLFLAFVGVWFPNAMFQDVLIIPMVNMLLLFFAGLTLGVAQKVAGRPAAPAYRYFSPLPGTRPAVPSC